MAWYNDQRPTSLEDVIGQDSVVKTLQSKLASKKGVPHFLLLAGPSGTGKTTVARCLSHELKCGEFMEYNAAMERGIEFVRKLVEHKNYGVMGGGTRIWYLDEAGALTKDAMTSLLKVTEDIPDHLYILFATTEPDSIIKTLRSRAMRLDFKPLIAADLRELMRSVAAAEGATPKKEVMEEIVQACDGSARLALMLLEQACSLKTVEEQLDVIQRGSPKRESIELCMAMVSGAKWSSVQKLLLGLESPPETIRQHVLGFMTGALLKNGPQQAEKAAKAIKCFSQPYHYNGKAGLALSCWNFFDN